MASVFEPLHSEYERLAARTSSCHPERTALGSKGITLSEPFSGLFVDYDRGACFCEMFGSDADPRELLPLNLDIDTWLETQKDGRFTAIREPRPLRSGSGPRGSVVIDPLARQIAQRLKKKLLESSER